MKRAIIVGSGGQDGSILQDQLTAMGYALAGLDRRGVRGAATARTEPVNLLDAEQVAGLVADVQPGEIYYLAAYHHSSQEAVTLSPAQLWQASFDAHVTGLLHFLEALRTRAPAGRLFYAASSLVFGAPAQSPQNEETPMNPRCVYGITKTAGIQLCRFYRREQGVFASAGILYNHESPRRRPQFLSQKVVRAAARIKHGLQEKLVLGDMSAAIDWGWAPDYADAMVRILQLGQADDFIVATGRTHTVGQLVEEAFGELGLDWRAHVEVDAAVIARRRGGLVGDAGKLRRLTGWQPTVAFVEMVRRLARAAEQELSQQEPMPKSSVTSRPPTPAP